MPSSILYFVALFVIVIGVFVLLRRPLYEAMAIAFVCLLALTGTWSSAGAFLLKAAKTSILYTICMFLVFSSILKRTGVIQECIDIILALVGHLPGGPGLVSLVSSAFMGALSGSGPGNVAATGSVTIPLMERAGYPPEFSAGISMAGSCLGPVIPPSATILSAFSCLILVGGFEDYTINSFWLVMYGISIIFFAQRILQFYLMRAALHRRPVPQEELPRLSDAWRVGWKSFLLVLVIVMPFIVDNSLGDWLKLRLGDVAAKNYSSAVLLFIPAVASAYSLLVSWRKRRLSVAELLGGVREDVKSIAPLVLALFFAYAISELLGTRNIVAETEAFLTGLHLPFAAALLLLLAAVTLLGMFMPGTSMIPLLGPIYIGVLYTYGVSPVLVAAMLPVLFVSLGQMTPPFAVCMFAAMGIAQSDFKKTAVHAGLWSAGQLLAVLLILFGLIPVPWL